MPHIPGAETSGVVEEVGRLVTSVKRDDRVIVYNKVFDGTCDMCLNRCEMLCRNGGKEIGVITNGGFAEYIAVPEKNVFKIPEEMQWEIATSLPVTTLTPYHALKEVCIKNKCRFQILGNLWCIRKYWYDGYAVWKEDGGKSYCSL